MFHGECGPLAEAFASFRDSMIPRASAVTQKPGFGLYSHTLRVCYRNRAEKFRLPPGLAKAWGHRPAERAFPSPVGMVRNRKARVGEWWAYGTIQGTLVRKEA